MSEIDSKQEDLQKSQRNLEILLPAIPHSEAEQRQLSSQESELNITEQNVDQTSQTPLKPLEGKAEGIDQSPVDSKHQEPLEEPPTNASQDGIQNQTELITATIAHSATPQQIETLLSSQPSPLTLETIYGELMRLRQDVQDGMQKLQSSIDFFTEELAVLKQTGTTGSPTGQTDRKRKQTQSSNLPRKTSENKQTRSNKLNFNAVTYLQEQGEAKLREELEKKANTELIKIARLTGIKLGKDSESVEREEMIKEIVSTAERRLKAGSVFLKDTNDTSET